MNGKKARGLRQMAVILSTAGDTENKVTPQETKNMYQGLKTGYKAELKIFNQIQNGRR